MRRDRYNRAYVTPSEDVMTAGANVLIVEDDVDVRQMIAEYLSGHGYDVAQAADGEAMRAVLMRRVPDVVLLDLNLQGENGLVLARWLRERYRVGIIMVTGASDVVDRIVGLEVGADDYIAKPFDPRELMARVRSVARRVQASASTADAPASPTRIPVGECTLDVGGHRLFAADGGEIPVTSMEFDLLRTFVEHPNRVLSRDQLLTLTRNREWEPFDRSIDIRIARLRRKIEPDPQRPRFLKTVRNAGYMYVPSAR
jgi:two-component system OmpR family response regulator